MTAAPPPGRSNIVAFQQFKQQLAPALAHRSNHQTHHRGQVHTVLTGLVGKAPELDLLFFQRLQAKSAA